MVVGGAFIIQTILSGHAGGGFYRFWLENIGNNYTSDFANFMASTVSWSFIMGNYLNLLINVQSTVKLLPTVLF